MQSTNKDQFKKKTIKKPNKQNKKHYGIQCHISVNHRIPLPPPPLPATPPPTTTPDEACFLYSPLYPLFTSYRFVPAPFPQTPVLQSFIRQGNGCRMWTEEGAGLGLPHVSA